MCLHVLFEYFINLPKITKMKTKYFVLLLLIASCIHYSDIHAINKVKIVTKATVNLDRKLVHQDFNRGKLNDLKRKYGDKVIISDHGELGVVMITSEHDQVSAADMVKEFDIELLDSYFDRSIKDRMQYLK